MTDVARAGDAFTRMLHAIDAKDWDGVRREFADTLEMADSSLSAGETWKIAGITLATFDQEGNLRIPEIARARVARE
jgi:hypothetical protein